MLQPWMQKAFGKAVTQLLKGSLDFRSLSTVCTGGEKHIPELKHACLFTVAICMNIFITVVACLKHLSV